MADDWRLTVDFDDEHDGVQLVERLGAREFAREEKERLGDRVVVSRDSAKVWHPVEEVWKDPSEPIPASPDEVEAEREARLDREAAESRASGHAEWEVRVELASRADTDAVAERLEADGIPVVRRSHYLLLGAANEEDAKTLGDRLKAMLPAGATVHVQPGGEMVWEVTPTNPFAILGGLGGILGGLGG